MGSRGPAPKRSSQRRRQNKTESVTKAPAGAVTCGEPLGGEHTEQAWWFWEALRSSGQARFYEPSDWAAAELVVIAIDVFVERPSAMMLASINSAMASLLVTEGDRRRARLELEREPPQDGVSDGVANFDDYRRRALGG